MDLQDLKKKFIREELGITDEYQRVFSFIDFGNVNKWFQDDRQDSDSRLLPEGTVIDIDLEKLNNFLKIFSNEVRFYYGHDPENIGSMGFLRKEKYIFNRNRVFTKPIQRVRHHLSKDEFTTNTRKLFSDSDGSYIRLPKCNFDVEISVDALKLIERYDTFCLLSGDADFVYLNTHLKTKGKKIIVMKGGHITRQLHKSANLVINAQNIKKYITMKKQKSGG